MNQLSQLGLQIRGFMGTKETCLGFIFPSLLSPRLKGDISSSARPMSGSPRDCIVVPNGKSKE